MLSDRIEQSRTGDGETSGSIFGMLYMKYFKKTNWKVALGALAVLIANTILSPAFNSNIQTTYVGIAAFLVLTFIAKYMECGVVKAICSFLSKYAYAIF